VIPSSRGTHGKTPNHSQAKIIAQAPRSSVMDRVYLASCLVPPDLQSRCFYDACAKRALNHKYLPGTLSFWYAMSPLPLSSSSRTRPVHDSLPAVKIPSSDLKPCQHHPVTGAPFTAEDLQHPLLRELVEKYKGGDVELAKKAREDAIVEVKRRMEENEAKSREIERNMEEKEKMREIERKVFLKQGNLKGRGGGVG
jgi:hypothetical protein